MVSTPKNMFFVWPNGFSFEKGALKVQPNKGRAEKTYFLLFYRKIAKKGSTSQCPKTVAQMLEITQPSLNICEIFINNSPLLPSKELTGSHLKGGSRRRLTNGNKKTFFRSPKNGFDLSPSSEWVSSSYSQVLLMSTVDSESFSSKLLLNAEKSQHLWFCEIVYW